MKWLVFLLVFVISATFAVSQLSDYPSAFMNGGRFTGQIIVGESAPSTDVLAASEIAVVLQQKSSSLVTANSDAEFVQNKNSILIGMPCHNSIMAQILETSACDIGLEEGEGMIRIIKKQTTYLVVTGNSAADTRKAARYIATNGLSQRDSEVRILGTLDNPVTVIKEPLEIKETPLVEVECNKNDDCEETEYCLVEKCLDLGCWEGTVAKNHDCSPILVEVSEPEQASEPLPQEEVVQEQEIPEESEPSKSEESKGFFANIIDFISSFFS